MHEIFLDQLYPISPGLLFFRVQSTFYLKKKPESIKVQNISIFITTDNLPIMRTLHYYIIRT